MRKNKLILSVLLLLSQAALNIIIAQVRPVSGDTIRGVIYESAGPMIMTNVTERDSVDRIVAHCITDMKGQFSFCLVNPGDRIRVDYIGYESFDTIIDRHYYEILMKERDDLPAVEITTDPGFEKAGYPMPVRITPSSVDTIDMSKFEHLM